jgi:RNA polymerase sigma factor (sigma-70 family)
MENFIIPFVATPSDSASLEAASAPPSPIPGTGAFRPGREEDSGNHPSAEALITEMRRGNPLLAPILRNQVLLQNLPVVVRAVAGCRPDSNHRDDCFSEGILALLRAIESYSPDRGTSFAHYATFVVRRRVRGHLANGNEFSFREATAGKLHRLRRLARECDLAEMTDAEIGEKTGITAGLVGALRPFVPKAKNLSPARSDDATSEENCETTLPGMEASPADQAADQMDRAWVVAYLREQLTPREWWVICSLYGLAGNAPIKPKEVARQLGISRPRVDQIAQAAIRKSRAVLGARQ